VLDHMDKDIVVPHVSIIGFHMVSVFLSEAVITFNSASKFFELFLQP
jgi:hypothetical protein